MAKRRVVVTGLGAVTPLGNSVSATWNAILKSQSGVGCITRFDASEFSTRIAAEVKNFDPLLALHPKLVNKTDVFVQFAVEAARQAFEDCGLVVTEENAGRYGVAIGSGIGGLPFIEKNHEAVMTAGPRRISPFFIPGAIINMCGGLVSMKYHLQGPNISIVTACTTGSHNIGHAARIIQYGDADVMLAGGAEMATTDLGIGGFAAAKALSKRNDAPQKASRPWDRDRDGFVLGEGAAVIVLEEYAHAKRRNAPIYAELLGFGMSADAYHMTAPEPNGKGFQAAMVNTLQDAQLSLDQIQYINAHGTSTPAADQVEALAIKSAFGSHAEQLMISSTKSMTGHMLGAAGAIEAIFSILAIRDNVVPPTINLDNPYEGCDLDFVPHEAREVALNFTMSNSFGFGGTNGSLIFSRI